MFFYIAYCIPMKISVSKLEKALSNVGVNYIDLTNDRNCSKWLTAVSTWVNAVSTWINAVSTGSTSQNTISTMAVWIKKAVTTVAWVRKAVTTNVLWS